MATVCLGIGTTGAWAAAKNAGGTPKKGAKVGSCTGGDLIADGKGGSECVCKCGPVACYEPNGDGGCGLTDETPPRGGSKSPGSPGDGGDPAGGGRRPPKVACPRGRDWSDLSSFQCWACGGKWHANRGLVRCALTGSLAISVAYTGGKIARTTNTPVGWGIWALTTALGAYATSDACKDYCSAATP